MVTSVQTTNEQLLEGAKRIGQLAEQEADRAEKTASISENVVNLMKETGITRIMLPKEYGGPQTDLRTFAEIVRTVSYYNVSAGWLTYLYPLHNVLPAYLPKKGRDEIINQGGLICDVFAAVGTCAKDGDGWRVNGAWKYASGVLFSDWIGLGVNVELPGYDKPQVCLAMLKKEEVEIVCDWDTFGLRGTGSNQVIAKNVYCPNERLLNLTYADTVGQPPDAYDDPDYPLYNVPFYPAFYLGFPYMALGGAKRVLDEFKTQTESRVRLMDGGIRESQSPRGQRVLAEMTTDYLAADSLMTKYLDLLEQTRHGAKVKRAEFFALRTRAIKLCVDIAVRAFTTLGGAAMYKGNVIELFLRDILGVATHKTSLYEDAVAAFGKELFGYDSFVRG
ncbi:acyl-CoA dehydrogenase family protein [Kyrpidia sp.]|uniref:acyl-CoA dehydrogenase family protein n=1 Tax=Kyrpidia sp. TaxID=2073077 RepID=UPI00258A4C81|nr:acyl-CoA dehydrogenase family protein [Kyrpidia sp.]